MEESNNNELLVMWTSGEVETAKHMVFMYTLNAKLQGWWEEVTLLIWGAASRLILEDETLQAELVKMQTAGVKIIACKACAQKMEVVEKLEALGIKVFFTGQFLTDWLQSDKKLITV